MTIFSYILIIKYMAIQDDGLHYEYREIDGYNKPFNFVLSSRELGKTTAMWVKKIYRPWKRDKRPWIYFVRQNVSISEALIQSIFDVNINKFDDDNVEPKYNKGAFKDGIVDVKIGEDVFFRIVSLSIPLQRIKLAVLKNIKGVYMDEYIINPKNDEKYQKNEAFKIKEAYTTWIRECEGTLKVYITANPYSLFNPLFVDWGVETNKLRRGEFYVGDMFVIHWAKMSDKLRAKLLEKNPLYQFDEDYSGYALEGMAINDKNIKLGTLPSNYQLRFVFRVSDTLIGVFSNQVYESGDDKYFCKEVDNVSSKRVAYCFEFDDLVDGTIIMSLDERRRLIRFKDAFRKRLIVFESIEIYYFIEEIYKNI